MSKNNFFQSTAWRYLTGSTDTTTTTEQRLFNSVCLFAFIGMVVCVLFNLTIGLYRLAGYLSTFLVLQAVVYYLSRFVRRQILAVVLFAMANYFFLSVNYIYNAGLTGPTLLAFFVSFYCLVAVTPPRYAVLWVFCHILTVAILSVFEYRFPHFIKAGYPSEINKFVDINITFYVLVIIAYFITTSIRNRYLHERRTVAKQAAIIERKNERLQHIDKERNRLFSIIAHDLRSPLTSINGYLELLTMGVLSDEERKEAEQHLLSLSTHTSEMLNNLLFWSKSQLEGNKQTLRTHHLHEVLSNTIQLQSEVAAKKGLTLTASIPADLTASVDRDNLDLVIRNLLSNAIKFTPTGGTVHICARQEDGYAVINIKDNGTGIPADKKPYIFTSEVKPTPGTNSEKGIGLGLLMCREFVEMQGGTISFQSQVGQGTTFTVRLKCDM